MKYRVVKSLVILENQRFDGSFHNAEVNIYNNVIKLHSSHELSYYCSDIFTSGRNKRTYTLKEFGVPFLGNSDVLAANPLMSCKYSSRKIGFDKNAILRNGMIVTGRVGAIGQTAIVPSYLEKANAMGSDNIIRILVKPECKNGFIYAYLASKIGSLSFWKHATGGVQPFITDSMVAKLPIPDFSEDFQKIVDDMIQESVKQREEATEYLNKAQLLLKEKANLPDLTPDYYDYYGPADPCRTVSTFIRKRKDIDTTTLNAFNHSERIRGLERMIGCECCHLEDVLLGGEFFSTGSFPRVEVKEKHGIMLINQSDIFDNIIKGKYISKRGVKTNNLVEYGEVMIAGVGTLGENETFCRTIFANEDLEGQLVSGEFLRMKTNGKVPSGYLYAWLSSDYGFRLIRSTQTGTKLCRPIQKLLLKKKIPIIDSESMKEIDELVREAHTKRHKANQMELKAISMVEQEIEKWSI